MSYIDTTYMMRVEVIGLLQKAEEKTGRSWEDLIARCIRKMLAEHQKYCRETRRIEYQKRFDEETGLPIIKRRVKMRFLVREYCYFQDVRKFFCVSISYAIAIAAFNYMDEVIAEYMCEDYDEFVYRRYDVTPCCHSVDLPM